MRKRLAYILVSLLYVCTSVLTCQVGYAAFAGGEDGEETQPRYSYTSFITAYVAENSDGDADCRGCAFFTAPAPYTLSKMPVL